MLKIKADKSSYSLTAYASSAAPLVSTSFRLDNGLRRYIKKQNRPWKNARTFPRSVLFFSAQLITFLNIMHSL